MVVDVAWRSEWNPGGKIGHDQSSGESGATYFSVASSTGAMSALRCFFDFLNMGGLISWSPPRFVRLPP